MKATVMYGYWVTATTAVFAAVSFVMLALSLHHSTRSVAGHHAISVNLSGGGGTGLGLHDGDI